MISVNFNIRNPWSQRFENLWNRSYTTPFNNKYIELEVFKDTTIVAFTFQLTTRQSHAGLLIDLGLFGHSISLNIYDSRHWSYETNRYYKYDESDI
jgi:hypothetical protein